jgi:thiamine phosphate synthase YjbQ (UPF0047 family)
MATRHFQITCTWLYGWQQVFYAEFDGRRRKRVVIKVMGE